MREIRHWTIFQNLSYFKLQFIHLFFCGNVRFLTLCVDCFIQILLKKWHENKARLKLASVTISLISRWFPETQSLTPEQETVAGKSPFTRKKPWAEAGYVGGRAKREDRKTDTYSIKPNIYEWLGCRTVQLWWGQLSACPHCRKIFQFVSQCCENNEANQNSSNLKRFKINPSPQQTQLSTRLWLKCCFSMFNTSECKGYNTPPGPHSYKGRITAV